MAFAFEITGLRQELRQSVAGTLTYWPKIAGTGNVAASSVSGETVFAIHDPSGAVVQASGDATVTAVGSVSRLDLSVSALATLDEGYQARITWRESGGSVDHFAIVPFDVVLYPLAPSRVSLNSLQVHRAEIEDVLTRHGAALSKTAAEMASIYGHRALVNLDRRIRSTIAADRDAAPSPSRITVPGESLYARPRLILNREVLELVEELTTLELIYAADMTSPDDPDDESSQLNAYFRDAAESAWRSIGAFEYDGNEDLVADEEVADPGRVVWLQRVQS